MSGLCHFKIGLLDCAICRFLRENDCRMLVKLGITMLSGISQLLISAVSHSIPTSNPDGFKIDP